MKQKKKDYFSVIATNNNIIKALSQLSEKWDMVALFNLNEKDKKELKSIYNEDNKVYIDDNQMLDMDYLVQICTELKKEKQDIVVLIDYTRPIQEDLTVIGQTLKQVKEQLQIDILIIVNYIEDKENKEVIDKMDLMQYADTILLHLSQFGIVELDLEEGKIIKIEINTIPY